MTNLDYLVLMGYIVGVFTVGGIFSARIRNSADMFAAGGQSPWWVSGLSGFMAMFSAGTFVVWGGIAYKHGIVAISINMCYGVAALLVGYVLAGRWQKMGLKTPAEYVELRFGRKAIHFYTWAMMFYRLTGVGVALYSLAVLLVALVPLEAGNPFRDPATGNLALKWAVLLFGTFVTIYTVGGGLWAVLMADVLQFIVLNMAVAFVVPLCFVEIGGVGQFIRTAPDGFFWPTTGEFTWFFLAGWCAIHFFMVGAEWAFVQRFICVPTAAHARKSAYLFGGLYLFSPFLWMLPPMLYRAIDPDANPEQAYILACRTVLPPGMMGLMMAAMVSATASMVSAQLNVFAGVLTNDFYRRLFRPKASEARLVAVGRIMTVVLAGVLICVALGVPYAGGAEKIILSVTALMVGPLLLPSVWGLFSKRVTQWCIWPTAGISFAVGALVKFGLSERGFLSGIEGLRPLCAWIQANLRTVEVFVGVVLPMLVLSVIELSSRGTSEGFEKVAARTREHMNRPEPRMSRLPALVVSWVIGFCGLLMALLAAVNRDQRQVLAIFSGTLFLIAGLCAWRYMTGGKSELE